jgi:hypothetical protein
MALVMAGRRPARRETALRPARASERGLWGAEDFIRVVLAQAAGGIAIVVAWYIGSGDVSFNHQIGPLDVAVAGAVVAGLGNVMWLLRGRRAVGARRRALLPDPVVAAIATGTGTGSVGDRRLVSSSAGAADAGTAAPGPDLFVAGEGLVRFHRPECALAVGRSWELASRQQHEDVGRLPCGVCRP